MLWCLALCWTAWADDRPAFEAWVAGQPAPIEVPRATGYGLTRDHARHLRDALQPHPDVQVERIGTTHNQAPIWAFHVPATSHETRDVLVFAGIHAMEWISTEVAVATLDAILADRRSDVAVTVVPLLNPDGRGLVEHDLVRDRNVYRRGNLKQVDLNRDFAWHRDCVDGWDRVLPGYHRTTGAPLSQPESQALDRLADRERYDRAASLHAFGGFFYFPWSGRWARPPHWAAFVHLGRAMEQAQGPLAYKTRQLSRWGFFFRAHGSEIDHLYGQYGTLAFLVELTRSGIRPSHLKDTRTYFRWYNPVDAQPHIDRGVAAMLALIDADLPSTQAIEDRREEAVGAVTVGPGTQEGAVHQPGVESGQHGQGR